MFRRLVPAALLLALSLPAFAATPQQVRNAVDSQLATFWTNDVLPKQAAYHAAHGHYWQGLATHSVPPADGTAVAPDNLAVKPYYESEAWLDVFPSLPATLAYSITCDQYQGPAGDGFVVTVAATLSGVTWMRSKGFGPEARDVAWTQAGS